MTTPSETGPREPSRGERRQIIDLLGDVYDTEAECYTGGETDETVANTLNVMPGWVAQLREQFFGPAGTNTDMGELAAAIDTFIAESQSALADAQRSAKALQSQLELAQSHREKLQKICKAVGPRVLRVAGVKE